MNDTQIILIPKNKSAVKVQEFGPINICNVAMKIITKTIGNRLKEILQTLSQ